MSIKTVSTIITSQDQMETQLASATAFARAIDAHLQVLALAVGIDQTGVVQSAFDAIPTGIGMEESLRHARELAEAATAQMKKEDIRWDVEAFSVPAAVTGSELVRHLRFSDLVIFQRAPEGAALRQTRMLAETVLFDADCPLLMLPETDSVIAPPTRIMVSWDESSAALRAARQAMPLLQAARKVEIVLVDPPKDAPDRSDPGGAFAQFLARHGIRCEVSVCSRTDSSIAGTLQRHAEELGSDLIVMGAYGHSRLRQAIFGGTTRETMEKSRVPVLMAH